MEVENQMAREKEKDVPSKVDGLVDTFSLRRFLDMEDWMKTICAALAVVVIVFGFLFHTVQVQGRSMQPTLHDKDRLLVSSMFYTPENGDIVVVRQPGYDHPLIKRVIATEGQTVSIDFNQHKVYVDGEELYEPYISGPIRDQGIYPFEYPVTVPEGCIFVLGDNRNNSSDSRYFGFAKVDHIIGKALFRFLPFSDFGGVD